MRCHTPRCTPYQPANFTDWLCSSASACPGPFRRRRLLQASGICPTAFAGTRRCWLRSRWRALLDVQGLGPSVNGIVVGAGDRTVTLNLAALECACAQWNLASRTISPRTPP